MGEADEQWLGEEDQFIAFRDECHAVIDELRASVASQAKEITRLRDERRWIPVGERLPDTPFDVLVTADGWIRLAYWHERDGWRVMGHGKLDTPKPPVAWMPLPWGEPLPAPPKPHGVRPALQPKPLGDVDHTARGFEVIRFRDDADDDCTLQQSSAMADGHEPGQSFVWLGVKYDRMHLSRRTVASLVAHLRSWLKRGTFTLEETK